jgi:hypothetical protein
MDPVRDAGHHAAMDPLVATLLLVALLVGALASVGVLIAGSVLAVYRGRRSRRRLVPPEGDNGR